MDIEDEELSDICRTIFTPATWRKQTSMVTWMETCVQQWSKEKAMGRMLGDVVIVGSVAEGLAGVSILMQGKSDICAMLILKNIFAIDRHFTPPPHKMAIVKMEHCCSLPGYVMLRNLNNLDTCSFHSAANYRDISNLVIGIHCNEWPSTAEEWIERRRPFNWPSGNQISAIIEIGCDLVPVGVHSPSQTKDLQWRISFARAERYLIHPLNNAQLKTFWLLNVLFKSNVLGELFHEKISSYIAKTSFLWISEEHNANEWKEGLCLKYTWLCLRKILSYVQEGCCPNYFMRECNLLQEKLNDHEKVLVCDALENFTREQDFIHNIKQIPVISGIKYFYSRILAEKKRTRNSTWVLNLCEQISQRCMEEILGDCTCMGLFLSTPIKNNWVDAVKELRTILGVLRKNPSELHNSSLHPFVIRLLSCAQIRLMNIVICHDLSSPENRFSMITKLLSSANLRAETLGVGEIVQIAHVFFTNSFYENTLHIVSAILQECKYYPCIRMSSVQSSFEILSSFLLNIRNVSFYSPRRAVCCLTFFKLEDSVLTGHLRLEVHSSVLDCEHADRVSSELFVVVHPLVYAHYMKYKCYRFLERNIDSCFALRELEIQVFQETDHKYHHLNLLGCSLYESGYFEEAMTTFALSYKERKSRQSVLYHMCILLLKCFEKSSNF